MDLLTYMPLIWTGLFIFFIILEAVTLALTSIWFAVAAAAAFGTHYLGLGIYGQIAVFLVLSGILILGARPLAKNKLKVGKTKTNVTALTGKPAVVTKAIEKNGGIGQIRLEGQIWTARSASSQPIPEGTKVIVERIKGVTAIVTPETADPPSP